MKRFCFLILILLPLQILSAQSFSRFLSRINSAPIELKTTLVDSFIKAVPAFPFIEDKLAHFILRQNAQKVTVASDFNNWNPDPNSLSKIYGTNLWYLSLIFEADARLDYKYIINGSNWILDPLNPNKVSGGFGPNSELRMPGYVMPPEIENRPDIAHGKVLTMTFQSQHLGNSRTIRIYTPPGYENSTDSMGVILFHDGLEYLSLASTQNMLDYLIAQRKIQPLVAVFVPPVKRTEEYAGNLQVKFTAFIVAELMPWVDKNYRVRRKPEFRATLGASNGGNIALWLGLNHPEQFGNIAAQSSYVQPSIFSRFGTEPKKPLKIYLDIGTYDIPLLVPMVRDFKKIIEAKAYPCHYLEFHEGHSWGNWRAHIDDALTFFFPASPLKINEMKLPEFNFQLYQNFPNPFNPQTRIEYKLREDLEVELAIYDLSGRLVRLIANGYKTAGNYVAVWDGEDARAQRVAGGIYFCQLKAKQQILTRKMILLD